jgi:hypothetical protein
MPPEAAERLDPESLVARIITELQANPAAQQMLLRAMLTNEFLGMPARLDAIERDVGKITHRVTALERDVASLKGDSLEVRIHQRIRPYLSQKLRLRRPRTVHSVVVDTDRDLQKAVYDAVDADRITVNQEARVFATDLILRAQRVKNRANVWVAVEASNTLDERDVERARESADALQVIFGEQSIAAVMGHTIPAEPRQVADACGVEVFLVEPNR